MTCFHENYFRSCLHFSKVPNKLFGSCHSLTESQLVKRFQYFITQGKISKKKKKIPFNQYYCRCKFYKQIVANHPSFEGKVVLDNLGFDVEMYHACEIDEDAMLVSMVNHGDSVVHLGDVRNLTPKKVSLFCRNI